MRVLPHPLARALHFDELNVLYAQQRETSRRSYERSREMAGRLRLYNDPAEQLRHAAVRHLRAVVEPKIKNAPDGRVLLSTLGNKEDAALAVILMGDLLQTMPFLTTTPPDYVTQFDRLVFTGGIYEEEGRQKFRLGLALPSVEGNGKLFTWTEFSNVRYVKELYRSFCAVPPAPVA